MNIYAVELKMMHADMEVPMLISLYLKYLENQIGERYTTQKVMDYNKSYCKAVYRVNDRTSVDS